MGMVKFDAYTLLLQGEDVLNFLDGLSTNLVSQSCTTVLTDRAAKIIDVCDVIVIDKRVALVGYGPNKTAVLEHFSKRLLGRQISFTDISHLNHVYIGIDDDERKTCARRVGVDRAAVGHAAVGSTVVVVVGADEGLRRVQGEVAGVDERSWVRQGLLCRGQGRSADHGECEDGECHEESSGKTAHSGGSWFEVARRMRDRSG